MKKILGIILIAIPFIVLAMIGIEEVGFKTMLLIFLTVMIVGLLFWMGTGLLID